ncbi:Tetraacyldisaccharide 4'-kinase [Shewanella sediminis HAW-EB3]|uniref:Tetraacyldisaccharide 4'-kinase n=1 Tax=Shewanella sediminis (strain HAW-EB3) TaxID=425104 RepID=LPXK_SHESH|nr:tetraacyldisaccharide 4'-kinase [Shewanella sediminis]A8FX59.1 RecName: Full=Tetraacyldisaccharide 4'-kinase; AltName: Full=Lipid A 4'-kinase [Shewanella sediminis HAW-EB3]ABV37432.1 Tetraacyldisaccharide 4'-kinase [Shewanella sediminis HAW-EB3]
MQAFVNRLWYPKGFLDTQSKGLFLLLKIIQLLLLPLSLLFAAITALRRSLFKIGIKKQSRLPVPVIVVGNITVGGSGKTPTVIYLVELLRRHGYQPGVISRGYGVNFEGVRSVLPSMAARDVGDEPAMIVGRTGVPMVIGRNRIDAGEHLLTHFNVDVIISDDGLQHYALGRDIELLILDGDRRFGNGSLLPAGPLREGLWRVKKVDAVVVNGGQSIEGEHAMSLVPSALKPVTHSNEQPPALNDAVVAIAGIGNPQRFFTSLINAGFNLNGVKAFEDHQAYCEEELTELCGDLPIIMTEKDAVKCRDFAKQNWWYLPVDAKLSSNFDRLILDKLKR